ncbi:hypothetical protein [Methylacidimicrobium sp. B4]|uniref:hypothetical protein n=1 Tax=Methylacidimicrobium sp. B4 TaxID=2796139 RepID=UPI001A905BE1|nr:hypothetical protein [Methylacidimicrobium sp. B4]QSR84581.1 hypothetical protein MacB4_10350 [Methylacidimicrobium sp. B4]
MSVVIKSTDDILAALRGQPEWREAVRREILTEELLGLPALVAENGRQIAKLVERVDKLTTDVAQLVDQVGQLTAAQERTNSQIAKLTESVDKIHVKMAEHEGKIIERDAREKLDNYINHSVGGLEVLERRLVSKLLDTAKNARQLSDEERADVGEADALAVGEDNQTGNPACVAAEIAAKVDIEDVKRARRRSDLFLKAAKATVGKKPEQWRKLFPTAPLKAYAIVIGREITNDAKREAEAKDVIFAMFHNGRGIDIDGP